MSKAETPLSVIMLTYNREKLVARAVESILAQTFADFEYIIINNGSTDRSGDICREYAKQDDRIRILDKENGNIGSGRNAALDLATGRYVIFIDDDDIAYPDMLEFLYGLVIDHDADISVCGSTKLENEQVLPNQVFSELLVMNSAEAVVELLRRKRINSANPCKLWKRRLFQNIRYMNEGCYDDIFVIYKLFAEAEKVVAHGLPKYHFYRHGGNNSSFTNNDLLLTPEQLEEYYAAFRERTEYLSSKLPSIADYARYSEWSYMISMCNKIIKNKLAHCRAQLSHARACLLDNYDEFYNSPYLENFEREYMDSYIRPYLDSDAISLDSRLSLGDMTLEEK